MAKGVSVMPRPLLLISLSTVLLTGCEPATAIPNGEGPVFADGRWSLTSTIESVGGAPRPVGARIVGRPVTEERCLTRQDVLAGFGPRTPAPPSCDTDDRVVANGTIKIELKCTFAQGAVRESQQGTYGADTLQVKGSGVIQPSTDAAPHSLTYRITGTRLGDCPPEPRGG